MTDELLDNEAAMELPYVATSNSNLTAIIGTTACTVKDSSQSETEIDRNHDLRTKSHLSYVDFTEISFKEVRALTTFW